MKINVIAGALCRVSVQAPEGGAGGEAFSGTDSSVAGGAAYRTVYNEERCLIRAVEAATASLEGTFLEGAALAVGVDRVVEGWKEEFFTGVATEGPLGASPLIFPYTSANALAARLSIVLAVRGETVTISSGALSFLKAVAAAWALVGSGAAPMAIVGGVTVCEAVAVVLSPAVEGAPIRHVSESRGSNGGGGDKIEVVKDMARTFEIFEEAMDSRTAPLVEAMDGAGNIVRIEFEQL